MDFTKIIDFLKLKAKYFFILSMISGLIIFLPENILTNMGLLGFKTQFLSWIGITFLASTSLIVINGLEWMVKKIRDKYLNSAIFKYRKKWLHKLTFEEKKVLAYYVLHKTTTQKLRVQSGIVNGLVSKGILYCASELGSLWNGFDFNIQPWAYDYLNENQTLLMPTEMEQKMIENATNY